MVRVGIVLSQQANQSLGTDVRVTSILRGFEDLGIHPVLFVPGGEAGRKLDEDRITLGSGNQPRFELVQLVARNVLSLPLLGNLVLRSPQLVRRHIAGLSESLRALDPDVDILQGEQQPASLAAIDTGRELNIPSVADLHGVWSEELVAYESTKRGSKAYNNIRSLESEILREADHVTVVSPEMRDYLLEHFSAAPEKITVVPSGAFPRVESVPLHERPTRVVFAGMLSPVQNIPLLLGAMAVVRETRPDVQFFVTDRGELARQVKSRCERMGLRAEFFWFEDAEEFFAFLASCDVGLVPVNLDRGIVHPTKLYTYMSAGLPIVANRVGPWSEIVADEDIGVVTENTPEDFARGILELLNNPRRIQECGQRGLDLLRTKFAYTREAQKFVEIYTRLTEDGNGQLRQ